MPTRRDRSAATARHDERQIFVLVPVAVRETRAISPVNRSFTNTSAKPLLSPATRLSEELVKTTKRPSPETEASPLDSCTPAPFAVAETSSKVSLIMLYA